MRTAQADKTAQRGASTGNSWTSTTEPLSGLSPLECSYHVLSYQRSGSGVCATTVPNSVNVCVPITSSLVCFEILKLKFDFYRLSQPVGLILRLLVCLMFDITISAN